MGTEHEARSVVALANAAWNLAMELKFRCPVGAEGVYAVTENGTPMAMRYWAHPAEHDDVFPAIHRRLDRLRRRGVPIPRLVHTGQVGGYWIEVAEWIDGAVPSETTMGIVDAAIAVTRSMRGAALADSPTGSNWLLSSIDDDVAGFCRPGRLLEAGPEGRSLLRSAQAAMRSVKPDDLTSADIVHCDFGLGNILTRGDSMVAVVDWSGCRDGAIATDLMGLWWDLALYRPHPGVLPVVETELAGCQPADVAAAACHFAVRSAASSLGRPTQDQAFALAWHQLGAL